MMLIKFYLVFNYLYEFCVLQNIKIFKKQHNVEQQINPSLNKIFFPLKNNLVWSASMLYFRIFSYSF